MRVYLRILYICRVNSDSIMMNSSAIVSFSPSFELICRHLECRGIVVRNIVVEADMFSVLMYRY